MMHFIFNTLAGWIGTAGLVVIACLAVGYFFPPFRRLALEVALVVLSAAAIYAKGNRDEAAKWKETIRRDIQKGQKARADAERDVTAGRVRGSSWDRDRSNL